MEQIKSTGLVLSEKNNLVQIPIGSHRLLFLLNKLNILHYLDGPIPDLLFWSRSEIARANNVFYQQAYFSSLSVCS
jgi:hypothetical protein